VRFGEDLDRLRVGRPHFAPPSFGLEYLDVEILAAQYLDVKRKR